MSALTLLTCIPQVSAYLSNAHEPVQQGSSKKQCLLVQLILTGHLHQPTDDNHAHRLVYVKLWLVFRAMVEHVIRIRQQLGLCPVQISADKNMVGTNYGNVRTSEPMNKTMPDLISSTRSCWPSPTTGFKVCAGGSEFVRCSFLWTAASD